MAFVEIDKTPGSKVPKPFERELKVLLAPETHSDVEGFTLLYSTLAPNGGCTDFHSHETSGELMIFVSGTGRAWLGGEEFALRPGVAMYAPPGVEHKTMNTGDEPLQIACVFVPPASSDYILKNVSAADGREGGERG
ncbi:MAG TPA: cupin domain-containing protein [bacterium]|nr:cupin domain-containing protein [bacterium]